MTSNGQARQPSERGRYAVYEQETGIVIGRVSGICQTCQDCGCGTPEEPIDLTHDGIMGTLMKARGMIGKSGITFGDVVKAGMGRGPKR
jgi:hypothetical protein